MHRKFDVRRYLTAFFVGIFAIVGTIVAIDAPARAVTGDASTADYALSFNGTSDYLEAAEGTQYASRAIYTVEAWAKPSSVTCATGSLCTIASHDGDWWIGIKDSKFHFLVYQAGQGSHTGYVDSGVAAVVNAWAHVTLVRNDTAITFYVNGVAVKTATVTSGRSTYSGYPLKVGAHYGNYYSGQIDELKIWSTVRDASLIASDMHNYQSNAASTSGLLAFFDFNEGGTNSTVNNRVGVGADLVFVNASPTISYVDVKSTVRINGKTQITFPRSYLTPGGGWAAPRTLDRIEILTVGGGGAGGGSGDSIGGGGGGGGGFLETATTLQAGAVSKVVVGQGGITGRSTWWLDGTNGQDSKFGVTITAVGGGGGGGRQSTSGKSGGSGGGVSGRANTGPVGGAGTAGQGYKGGDGRVTASGNGGGSGGGGAGSAGSVASGNTGGAAGTAKTSKITGTSYAGGGAGGTTSSNTLATSGATNSGSGGAGSGGNYVQSSGGWGFGGSGGSGIVVVSFAAPDDKAFVPANSSDKATTSAQIFPSSTSQDFTFEAWIRPNSFPSGHQPIITSFTDSNFTGRFYLGTLNDANNRSKLYVAMGSGNDKLSTISLVASEWTHIAVTLQGTTLTIYLNGILDSTHSNVPRVSYVAGMQVGHSSNTGTTRFFDGQIDQIKTWNAALSASALTRSMEVLADTDASGQINANLQHAYDFNEEVSNTYLDFNGSADLAKAGTPTLSSVSSATSSGGNSTYRFPRTFITAFGGWFPPVNTTSASVLAVAGGGGGGAAHAGGGGAGGVAIGTGITLTGPVSIKVGRGGFGHPTAGVSSCDTNKIAYQGQSTVVSGVSISGGGAGSNGCGGSQNTGGGSGGGASYASTEAANNRGLASLPSNGSGWQYLGNNGGFGFYNNPGGDDQWLGGGGGGAGGIGATATSASAGAGGAGYASTLSGSNVCYAAGGGGGGGSAQSATAGAGGTCSGLSSTAGAGSRGQSRAGDATPNTGSGGGGGGYQDINGGDLAGAGGHGAAGVVIASVRVSNQVSFDANGGTGSMSTQTINVDSSANLTSEAFTRTGFTFNGWATSANGSVVYADGASITPSGDMTLYAVWTSDLPSVNVAFDELNFDFSNVVHIVGTNGKTLNNKVLFRNVTTKGGVQVDALVTTEVLSSATITNYESGTGAGGDNSYFQVDAAITATNGYAQFKFDFYQHGVAGPSGDPCTTSNTSCTGATKVKLQNVNVSAIDIDYYQWNDFTAVESYTLAGNSQTQLLECPIPNSGTCTARTAPGSFPANMRFQGSSSMARTNDPVDMAIVSYAEIETFRIKFGRSSANNTNYYGVAFKALSWGVQTPSTSGGTSYTVTYDKNTASGNAPTSSTGVVGSNVTLPTVGAMTKAGFTFAGWNTAADGSGTNYAAGNVMPMPTGGATLYAKWTANQYMLIYKLYGGLNGPATEMRSTGAVANLSSTQPTRDGAVFSSWNTAADGSGTTYAAGASFTMPGANTTLHAMYTTATGTIAYNANNGSNAPSSSNGTSGTTVAAAGAGSMTRSNYTFSGWNTAANGSGTDYSAGANVAYPGNGLTTTLYAQWTPILYSYSYNANGGTGAPSGGSTTAGSTVTIPSSTTTRTGYTFDGWTTSADGSGTVYTNGGANPSLTMPGANTVLYAKWSAITYTLAFNSNDAGAGANPTSATGTYGANLAAAAAPTAPTGKKFNGWNTAADGSGATYAAGGNYQITANATLYAQWVADTVNLFYSANGGSGAPTSTTASANSNTTLSGTAPSRTGFTFSGWTTAANGSGTVYGVSSTFPVPGSDTTLYAKWTPIGYNFIYNANGGSGAPSTVAYFMGEFVVIDNSGTTVRTGYTFAGWNTLADGTGSDYVGGQNFLMSNSNMTMYAKWTSNPFTLTYNGNLGSGSPTPETRNAGSTANLSATAPTRTGYTFNGWNTAQNGSGTNYNSSASYVMPTTNSTLYAQWTANSNALAYNANNGSGAPSGGTFRFGSTVTVSNTAPTRTGYTFLGWNTAADGTGTNYSAADTFAMPNSSVTLYARWSILQKTVSYDANGGAGVDSPATYNFGATVTVSTAQVNRSGYSFIGWNTMADGSGTTRAASATFTMPANDVTLYAIWSINAYTVYYNMNGGTGSVTPQPGNFGTNVTVAATLPTRTGFTFSGWNTLTDGSGTDYSGGGTLTIPSSNVTLYAKWTPIMYSVSFNANGGSGSPSDVNGLTAGSTTTLSATTPTRTGYVFNGWNTALDGSGQTYAGGQNFMVPAANTVFFAQWVANTYEIIYNANGGTNAPTPANGSTNSTVTLTSGSVTRAGYTHLGWSTNSSATTATYYGPSNLSFVVPAGNTILYAVWALADITVTYNINNGSGSTPSAVTDKYLETITLAPSSAFSRSGYTFNGWNTAADGSGSSYAAEANFVMPNADKTLYAQWSAVYYAVEYSANGGSNAPANQFAVPGATVAVPTTEPLKSGYEFNDWTQVAAGTTVTPGATLTMPSSNVVLVANWVVSAASVPSGSPSTSNPSPSPSPSPSASPVKKKLTQTVYFKGDSAVLQSKAKQQLKDLAKKAVINGYALRIQVIGRVKETPDKSYDMRLSRQRAQNVANYLKTLKVQGKWVVTAAGISPENKAISRRVDVSIVW